MSGTFTIKYGQRRKVYPAGPRMAVILRRVYREERRHQRAYPAVWWMPEPAQRWAARDKVAHLLLASLGEVQS